MSGHRPYEDEVLYRFATNVVAAASAGTGKTYRLAGVYLHLVLGLSQLKSQRGSIAARRIPAHRILATTFTRDAASEMRARIEARLRLLVTLTEDTLGPLLEHSSHGPWLRELMLSAQQDSLGSAWAVARELKAVAQQSLLELPNATIGTLHSFAADVLRSYAMEAGIPPGFTVLDDSLQRDLVDRSVNQELSQRLADDTQRQRLSLLFRVMGGREQLVAALQSLLGTMGEEGKSAESLQCASSGINVAHVLGDVFRHVEAMASLRPAELWRHPTATHHDTMAYARAAVERARSHLDALMPLLEELGRPVQDSQIEATLEQLREQRHRLLVLADDLTSVLSCLSHVRSPTCVELRESIDCLVGGKSGGLGERVGKFVRKAGTIACSQVLTQYLRELACGVAERLEKARLRAGGLDFSSMMLKARDLLRDHPLVQREVASRFDALLLDEFQDTNRVQRDLVYLLHQEQAAMEVRAPGEIPAASSLRRSGLLLVGDRKQSIYGFRGADIAVFQQVCVELCGLEAARALAIVCDEPDPAPEPVQDTTINRQLELIPARKPQAQSGSNRARLVTLDVNRRSHADLLTVFNEIAAADMRFDPDEPSTACLPASERLSFTEAERLRAPSNLVQQRKARLHIVHTVAPEATRAAQRATGLSQLGHAAVVTKIIEALRRGFVEVETAQGPCQVPVEPRSYGQIAVLVRSYGAARPLGALLDERAIPFVFGAKGGLFSSPEVLDVVALARLLADPHDAMSLVNVLRGPLVGVRDATLLVLAKGSGSRGPHLPSALQLAAIDKWLEPQLLSLIDPAEQQRIRLLGEAYLCARRNLHRLGPRGAVALVLEAVGFEETLAALARASQRISNVRALLREIESAGSDLRAFLRMADAIERSGDDVSGPNPSDTEQAVRVMTIHGSKGLEFPVVVLMQAGALPVRPKHQIAVARGPQGLSLGLALGPGSNGTALHELQFAREWCERQRLSYVAMTRAKEELFIVGSPPKQAPGSFWASIQACAPKLVAQGLGRELHVSAALPPVRPVSLELPQDVSADAQAELHQAQQSLCMPASAPEHRAGQTIVVVTALASFASCPRKYELAHLMGLEEHPGARDQERQAEQDEAQNKQFPVVHDAREKGTVMHEVLEAYARSAWGDASSAQRAVESPGHAELFVAQALGKAVPECAWRDELAGALIRFLQSEQARSITQAVAFAGATVLVEHPFFVPVREGGLFLKGTMDLAVVTPAPSQTMPDAHAVPGVLILDYKSGQERGRKAEGAYRMQLAAYRFAARRLWPEAGRIQTGLVYLGGPTPSVRVLDEEASIDELALKLVEARIRAEYAPLGDATECRTRGCGFVPLCYPG